MKKTVKDKFIDLISIRKFIAIIMTTIFCILIINGNISKEEFLPIFGMIIGYYFGKSTALDKPGDDF
jgi:hypothetical protein